MVQGTMDAADGKAAEALGLAGEGAQAGVNMAVGKRRHSGVAMLLIWEVKGRGGADQYGGRSLIIGADQSHH